MDILIPGDVKEKIAAEHLSVADVKNTVSACLDSGRFVCSGNGICSGYRRTGYVTCWVEFSRLDDVVTVKNAYSHRIEIVER
ncbi:MAG: hypothetical protein ACOX4I_02240 [Anaerovoracaceae bacterium]|jgi:hypothetical protein